MIKILYVIEPMLGIGPNMDANLIAKKVAQKFANKINIKIVLEKDFFSKKQSKNISWECLSPWRFDFINDKLVDLNGKELSESDKRERAQHLIKICKNYKPDVLLLHNYMSGSKWDSIIDFEMLPLIEFAKNQNQNLKVYSYMIGMLDGFENVSDAEAVFFLESIKKNIDKIFLRSDNLSLFIKTCPPAKKIKNYFLPIGYSGNDEFVKKIIDVADKFIVVSAGGGDIALNLFKKSIEACSLLDDYDELGKYKWIIFLGPMQEKNKKILEKYIESYKCSNKINLFVGADEEAFLSYLMYNCIISISQCGQRTFTNLEMAGVNSIVIPRESNGKEFEQLYRALYMENIGRAKLIRERDLTPEILIRNIKEIYKDIPKKIGIKMNGPENLIRNILDLSVVSNIIKK